MTLVLVLALVLALVLVLVLDNHMRFWQRSSHRLALHTQLLTKCNHWLRHMLSSQRYLGI